MSSKDSVIPMQKDSNLGKSKDLVIERFRKILEDSSYEIGVGSKKQAALESFIFSEIEQARLDAKREERKRVMFILKRSDFSTIHSQEFDYVMDRIDSLKEKEEK